MPAVTKAHLPTGSSFYYDNDLKKWVNKNATVSSTPAVVPAPPPKMASLNSVNRSVTPDGLRPPLPQSVQAIGAPPSINHSKLADKRGARSKYVDILNPNASVEHTAPVFATFVPSFASSGGVGTPSIFVPKPSDRPSLYSMMLKEEKNAADEQNSKTVVEKLEDVMPYTAVPLCMVPQQQYVRCLAYAKDQSPTYSTVQPQRPHHIQQMPKHNYSPSNPVVPPQRTRNGAPPIDL